MPKADRRVAVWLLLLAGCGRSEQSIKTEFAAYVAGANQCQAASDCAVAAPGCPGRRRSLRLRLRCPGAAGLHRQSLRGGGRGRGTGASAAPAELRPGGRTTNRANRPLTLLVSAPGLDYNQTIAALPLWIQTWPEKEKVAAHLMPVVAAGRLGKGQINGARFRPDSHPPVRGEQICDKAAPGMKLIVQFSHPASCPLYWAQPDARYFTCDELTATSVVAIGVSPGLKSASGLALPASGWTVDVAQLPAGSCREYRAPF